MTLHLVISHSFTSILHIIARECHRRRSGLTSKLFDLDASRQTDRSDHELPSSCCCWVLRAAAAPRAIKCFTAAHYLLPPAAAAGIVCCYFIPSICCQSAGGKFSGPYENRTWVGILTS